MTSPQRTSNPKVRIVIGLVLAAVAFVSYLSKSAKNDITGEVQQVSLSPQQEIATGLAAIPSMERQYGGVSGPVITHYVESVGERVVARSEANKTPYKFRFIVLADQKTVNAFALPGGPVFITEALLRKLPDEAALAGVLGHEIGHVVARHGSQQLAKSELAQGIVTATAVAADDQRQARLAAAVSQMVVMKYGRDDELQADALGVRFMAEAGYDANAMLDVLTVLKNLSAGGRQPEFFSTHPNPENRIEEIHAAIEAAPQGGERSVEEFQAVLNGEKAAAKPKLPPEALETLKLIEADGPFPYPRDGLEFQNREGALPEKPAGYYREYTVETPGAKNRGARRIITGQGGERYFTEDHYETFLRIE
jgi:predicted Zn-dependent protease